MTHGEKWYADKLKEMKKPSLKDQDGRSVALPDRMERAEALQYYNAKLEEVWLETFEQVFPDFEVEKTGMRKAIVEHYMYRRRTA